MRLINVETFKVEEFLEGRVPPYAILSHTWLPKGEVKFSDMADSAPRPVDMPGWYKIQKSAEQAKEDGHAYIWVDTCCIDKSSSAELSEAINSMFAWDIFAATAAERMSWASKRTTTRKEDMAYCLLGIFGINMPLLYGERDRAFIRLQKEIIANHNDLSILSWEPVWEDFDPEARDEILKIRIGESQPWKQTNAMATSVRNFTSCQGIDTDAVISCIS
ncbi:hypothetical protein SEUCBS140593_000222 [Sporothrix eucalyptigena]|uniref:Heterokaryon incompatibility domain-containing protein n=1 Tax=Sporothrix eucalyptigena TaxID=1812306 RepID=A0ABP0AMY2_9PEZI